MAENHPLNITLPFLIMLNADNILIYFFRVRNSRSVTEMELPDWLPRGPYHTVRTSRVFAPKQAEE